MVERLVDDRLDSQTDTDTEEFDLNAITGLAPFLDAEYLDALVKRVHVRSLKELSELAPFLGSDTLDALVENADPEKDMSHITSLAPFLCEETLGKFLGKLPDDAHADISWLYPFLLPENLAGNGGKAYAGTEIFISRSPLCRFFESSKDSPGYSCLPLRLSRLMSAW